LYDAYITGSDQVWNPRINNNDSSWFLTFAPPGKTRIAYAASFGVSQIPGRLLAEYSSWLGGIHSLSTREFEGQQIIEQLAGRHAEVVLDPTLLLDPEQWREIAVPFKFNRPYLLCYCMPVDKHVTRSIARAARQVSTLMGWDAIWLGQREYMRLHPWRRGIYNAGPAEFLGLLQDASLIVTNSYHGAALAIDFCKPFYVYANYGEENANRSNSRIATLLKTFRLEGRLLAARKDTPQKYDLNLDHQAVASILQEERRRAIDFLRAALEGSGL
jgi:hypothetical protein